MPKRDLGTVEIECPVCSEEVEFPRWDHERAGDPPCSGCTCIGEDEERICAKCGARIVWHTDGEVGWSWVDDDDPAWTKEANRAE